MHVSRLLLLPLSLTLALPIVKRGLTDNITQTLNVVLPSGVNGVVGSVVNNVLPGGVSGTVGTVGDALLPGGVPGAVSAVLPGGGINQIGTISAAVGDAVNALLPGGLPGLLARATDGNTDKEEAVRVGKRGLINTAITLVIDITDGLGDVIESTGLVARGLVADLGQTLEVTVSGAVTFVEDTVSGIVAKRA